MKYVLNIHDVILFFHAHLNELKVLNPVGIAQ